MINHEIIEHLCTIIKLYQIGLSNHQYFLFFNTVLSNAMKEGGDGTVPVQPFSFYKEVQECNAINPLCNVSDPLTYQHYVNNNM